MTRALAMPVLLAASVGVPYVANNPPEWLEQGFSSETPAVSAAGAAPAGVELHGLSTPSEARIYQSPTPLAGHTALSLEQALNLNVTKEWVYQHWPRKSTGLAEIGWFGVRVPLVTGTRLDDVAGSLTYYFGADNLVHRITLRGRTADTTRLVALATGRYGMSRQAPVIPSQQLYQLRQGDTVVSELTTRPSNVLWDSLPHESFSFVMHIQRPETARPLPKPVPKPASPASPAAAAPQGENAAAQPSATEGDEAPSQAPAEEHKPWQSPRTQVPKPRVEDLNKLHRYR